jgi:hypothetical protein
VGWNYYRFKSVKNDLAQDDNDDMVLQKNFKLTAGFLVFLSLQNLLCLGTGLCL